MVSGFLRSIQKGLGIESSLLNTKYALVSPPHILRRKDGRNLAEKLETLREYLLEHLSPHLYIYILVCEARSCSHGFSRHSRNPTIAVTYLAQNPPFPLSGP